MKGMNQPVPAYEYKGGKLARRSVEEAPLSDDRLRSLVREQFTKTACCKSAMAQAKKSRGKGTTDMYVERGYVNEMYTLDKYAIIECCERYFKVPFTIASDEQSVTINEKAIEEVERYTEWRPIKKA